MQIAVLGKADSWHALRLQTALAASGAVARIFPWEKLAARIGLPRTLMAGSEDLAAWDAVLVRGIPAGSLEQVVFRMDSLHRLAAAGVPVVNPPAAIEACVDKFLASARLAAAGLPTPRTVVCESPDAALAAFAEFGGRAVVKPLFGSEGRGIVQLSDQETAWRVCRAIAAVREVIYLQEFVRHPGHDFRAFVVGGQVVAAMRRHAATDFRTNASLGGRCEAWTLPADWANLACRAATTVGAAVAGVDLLPDADGHPLVVEVNSAPGFRALEAATGIDVATAVADFLLGEAARLR